MKSFFHLLFLDPELLRIGDRKPLASAVYLEMCGKLLFQWGFLYGFHDLCLEVIRPGFEDPEVHETSWDRTSGDDDFPSVRSQREAFSSEYEFIDMDISEDVVFFHAYVFGRV